VEDKIKQFLKTIKMNESLLSMLFGMVTVVLVGVLVFRMYQSNKPEITDQGAADKMEESAAMVGEVPVEVKEDGKKYPVQLPETYTVQAGDHLWMIAEKQYGSGYNWVDIAKENDLMSNPGVIEVGQELKLPKVAVVEIQTQEAVASADPIEAIEGDSYTVVKGDNLWAICVRAYGDGYRWPEVANFNELTNPNLIEVDQVIKLPR